MAESVSTIRTQIDEALAKRSYAGVFAYALLLSIVLWSTSARTSYPTAAYAVLAWMLGLGVVRLAVAVSFARHYAAQPRVWRIAFRVSTLLAGVSWGVACAVWTHLAGLGAESELVLVTTAGITAGAITSLSPSLILVRAYVAGMLVPTILGMAVFGGGTRTAWSFALVLGLYFAFLLVESRQLHRSFVLAIERTLLLQSRAAALAQRTESMQLVLESVDQGFLKVDRSGQMDAERSAILDRWLGPSSEHEALWTYIGRTDPVAARRLQFGWQELADDIMPAEVVIDQLPVRLHAGATVLDMRYRPRGGTPPEEVVVILSDITATLAKERSERDQRELMAVFEHIQRDRAGVLQLLDEGDTLIDVLLTNDEASPADVRRWVHTLKGNAGLFGLERVAEACHSLESSFEDQIGPLTPAQRSRLEKPWRIASTRMKRLLGGSDDRLEVDVADHRALQQAIAGREPHPVLQAILESWTLEPTQARLSHIAAQAAALAERLGKRVEVDVQANGVRLEAAAWSPFWASFVHLLRNAIDHGIEPEALRLERGKPALGRLVLRTTLDEAELVVSLSDDGGGIDWQRLALRAAELGLPHTTRAELEQALFADAVSTADAVSEISGRGVGLGAFRDAVHARQGHIVLTSEPGAGTTWQMRFPRSAGMAARAA